MKSSSGAYFIALDQLRAVAVFMVVAWHFTHGLYGYPIPFEYTPAVFPFALLDEGHTGVSLFMTLSGYLFAKLLDGKTIHYGAFFWNRALRLLPLLTVVLLINGVMAWVDGTEALYLRKVARGFVSPSLPNGAWSITVEFHFYLFVLPVFLWVSRRSRWLPLGFIVLSIAFRWFVYWVRGEVESLAYWTIVGRVDQFALGLFVFSCRGALARRHWVAGAVLVAFAGFYWFFDALGGLYKYPFYPSPKPLWIILPTIEGIAYSVLIAWYDNSFTHPTNAVARFVGRIGEYSYSIYLLHYFVVFRAASFVQERIMSLTNFYLACAWAAVFLLAMMPVAFLSFRYVEAPFLRLRKRYVVAQANP